MNDFNIHIRFVRSTAVQCIVFDKSNFIDTDYPDLCKIDLFL